VSPEANTVPPPDPAVYDADVDEMSAGGLAVLADLRGRLAADLAWNPQIARRVIAVVDEHATEIATRDDDDEETC
jgi:hypothetical protein